ncbi:anti-sigma factor [Paraburkholderia sp. CNPSo 3274]|uniref:anti-sigma factor n=1 Tax=Paraburkholderia sp. CNPSo 3274 TaxID=2940932 RepID=UPI0020B6D420|nr:anti-sigma factor [Paraburkholderia sp. CNPSo 3274]MCP3708726.1 anti-sigma factor [Paraburkholderia sp. CNPSo 3274]
MIADDAQLLAYVDGRLSPDERAAIEAQLRESTEARKKVTLLRASQVDFAGAFAQQTLPPVPESLRLGIEEMVRAQPSSGENDEAMSAAEQQTSSPVRSRLRRVPVWLAAACVAGAFLAGQFVRFDSLFGPGGQGSGSAQLASASDLSPWVKAAVGYQKLYTRETVAYRQDDPALAARVVEDIRRDDRLALRVPDLSSAGLTFKSVQRLRFHDKPLVQIVYLPRSGPPIALCVMKDARPDEAVASRTVDSMGVTTWRQNELTYALIGGAGDVDLAALGKRISNLDTAALFSEAQESVSPFNG